MKATIICLVLGISLPLYADKVEFNQLPPAVQKAISDQKGADVKKLKIDKETKDGRVVYEVEFEKDGNNPKLHFAEDGTLVNKDAKDSRPNTTGRDVKTPATERNPGATTTGDYVPRFPRLQSVQLGDVPQPVQNTIQQQAAGRKIADIDKETWNGQPVYEVEFAQSGRNAQIHIAADGTIVKSDRNAGDRKPGDKTRSVFMGTQLAELPTAAQATIKREAAGREIVDIDKEKRDGRVVYEVEIKQEGKNIELHVAEDGTIVRDSRKEDGKLSKI